MNPKKSHVKVRTEAQPGLLSGSSPKAPPPRPRAAGEISAWKNANRTCGYECRSSRDCLNPPWISANRPKLRSRLLPDNSSSKAPAPDWLWFNWTHEKADLGFFSRDVQSAAGIPQRVWHPTDLRVEAELRRQVDAHLGNALDHLDEQLLAEHDNVSASFGAMSPKLFRDT